MVSTMAASASERGLSWDSEAGEEIYEAVPCDSPLRTTVCESMPWRMYSSAQTFLPSGVLGPVERRALARLARI